MNSGVDPFDNVVNEQVEIAFVDDFCHHIKTIVEEALVKFDLNDVTHSKMEVDMDSCDSKEECMNKNYEEYKGSDDDVPQVTSNKKKGKQKIHLTMNYFENEVKRLKRTRRSPYDTANDDEVEDVDSATSYVTGSLVNHKNYKKALESKHTLCQKRAALELIVSSAQKKQAEIVNRKRLESKHFGSWRHWVIRVPPILQGSTDLPYVPVMVTKIHISNLHTTWLFRWIFLPPNDLLQA
jgi:hypothetical protein